LREEEETVLDKAATQVVEEDVNHQLRKRLHLEVVDGTPSSYS
jgi:hypothetical protein